MVKLTRITGKVFGSNATATVGGIGQFGSAVTGTPNLTTDVATIQALPAYLNGWGSAVVTSRNFPPIEEVTGVLKTISYQACYTLQEGIPEYDINTEYSNTSLVKSVNNGIVTIYASLQNNNIGNSLSNGAYWKPYILDRIQRNIGEIVQSAIPLTDAGLHLLDGSLLSGSGSYGAFVTYIAGLYTADPTANYFTTEAEWQTSVSTYGVCGKFVYDSVNNTVRLPKYSNQIYTSDIASSAPVKGNGNTLGLYDGENQRLMYQSSNSSNVGLSYTSTVYSSPLLAGSADSGSSNVAAKTIGVSTNENLSGLIANLSNITTPLDGYYYIVIATSTKTQIQVDIDEIATDLNGKADVDLTNAVPTSAFATALNDVDIVTIVESFVDGTEWYNVYSNGFCEQGGVTATFGALIDLYKEYKDTNYTGQATIRESGQQGASQTEENPRFNAVSTTQCFVSSGNVGKVAQWVARGYIS